MAKRKRYTDEFRASAVLMLQAAGWPDKKGALMAVSNKLHVPYQTLSRWGKGTSNPPPHNIVHDKRNTLLDLIEIEIRAIYAEMPKARPDASYRDLGIINGVLHDKHQLLKGEPTQRVENLTTEQRRDRVAELFEKARARRTSDAS